MPPTRLALALVAALTAPAAVTAGQPNALGKQLIENRYALSISNGQFAGPAAQLLRSAIGQSRFVLVGEEHGLAETDTFWIAVCDAAAPAGFRTMAIEDGPLEAAELEQWIRQPDGEAQLTAFERQNPESILLDTREEFAMLRRCASAVPGGKFRVLGVNQESLGGAGHLLEKILETHPAGASEAAVRRLLQENTAANAKALQTGKISDLFMIAADDKELSSVVSLLNKEGSPQARSLMQSLIESHEINRAWPRDGGRRGELMKKLFAAEYAEASKGESSPPKVLLKFGSFHIYRGMNPMGGSGIGNYVAGQAEAHGAHSIHIAVMPLKGTETIYPRIGQPPRQRPFNLREDQRSKYLEPLLSNTPDAGWTVFDLRPFRQKAMASVSPELKTLITGIDVLVFAPEGTPTTRIH